MAPVNTSHKPSNKPAKENEMEYLIKAQNYCRGTDTEPWFCECYTLLRETNGVKESAWKALVWLFGEETAKKIFLES